jgi:fucose permease
MQATLLGTLLPEFSKTVTPGQSGTLASVQSLGLIVASLGTGPVIDRTGAKTGVLAGLGLIAMALLILPSAHAFGPLLLMMTLLGLGGGAISTSTNTLASLLGGANPASTINLLNVFFGLGGLATPALGAFLSTAALCRTIVLLAACTFLFHAVTPVVHTSGGRGFRSAADGRLLFRPLFILLCLFLFLYVAAEVGIWNWLAAWLTGKGIPKNTALRVLSFGFATGIITGRLAVSRVLLRFRSSTVTLVCSLLMAVTTSALLLATGPVSAAVAVFCAGLSMAPVYPTTLALVGEAFPRGTATAIGIAVTTGWIGVAVSSKMIGGIAGNDPNRLSYGLLVIPVCSGLMFLVNLVFRTLLPRSAVSTHPQ